MWPFKKTPETKVTTWIVPEDKAEEFLALYDRMMKSRERLDAYKFWSYAEALLRINNVSAKLPIEVEVKFPGHYPALEITENEKGQ